MNDACIFCKIINGDTNATFVYQGQNIVAFKDIKPSAPVHILVVPKKHIRSINDLEERDAALMSEMLLAAKDIAREQGTDQTGYKLVFNVERGGGQYVFHIHLHILGGWEQGKHPRLAGMPI
jgi:histidine triad (HIT) family protein